MDLYSKSQDNLLKECSRIVKDGEILGYYAWYAMSEEPDSEISYNIYDTSLKPIEFDIVDNVDEVMNRVYALVPGLDLEDSSQFVTIDSRIFELAKSKGQSIKIGVTMEITR